MLKFSGLTLHLIGDLRSSKAQCEVSFAGWSQLSLPASPCAEPVGTM